jgi:pimeloyl-ACP methyl ester carboxylesterase
VTAATVEGAGVELAYDEHGSGPAVVLMHGAAATRAVWRETREALGDGFRTIAYDRRGYGSSGAPEAYAGTTFEEQAEDAAALLRSLEAPPALACGHSLGAGVCLDLMKRHTGLLRGAVLVEPPVLSLSPAGPEEMGQTRAAIERGAREGGPAGAVDAFLGTFGGDVLERLGAERLDAARAAPRAVAADLGAASAWNFTRRELGAIETPAIVLSGMRSSEAWREAASVLASLLGNAELRHADAGHFVPLDAPAAVADAIRALDGSP